MTTWIVRTGSSLLVEIPGELARQAGLVEGQAVEWIQNADHGLTIVKKTITDGLLEIESRISRENALEERILAQRKRAELGDIDSQRFLGMISTDKAEKTKWLKSAAEQGDKDSMYYLAHSFLADDGPEKNNAEAYFWLFLDASTYSLKSTKVERSRMKEDCIMLQHIATNLTEQEQESTKSRCREWLKDHNLTKCFNPTL